MMLAKCNWSLLAVHLPCFYSRSYWHECLHRRVSSAWPIRAVTSAWLPMSRFIRSCCIHDESQLPVKAPASSDSCCASRVPGTRGRNTNGSQFFITLKHFGALLWLSLSGVLARVLNFPLTDKRSQAQDAQRCQSNADCGIVSRSRRQAERAA